MFDKCIYFNLTTLTRQVTKIWQESFQSVGLSPSHGYLLYAMATIPDATQKELGELMELDASTITRFIDTLVKKRFVKKEKAGKGATFTITERGSEIVEEISLHMDELYSQMQESLGKRNFKSFVSNVRDIKKTLEEKTI